MDAGLKIKSFFAEVLRKVADDADPNQVNKELEPSSMLHPQISNGPDKKVVPKRGVAYAFSPKDYRSLPSLLPLGHQE